MRVNGCQMMYLIKADVKKLDFMLSVTLKTGWFEQGSYTPSTHLVSKHYLRSFFCLAFVGTNCWRFSILEETDTKSQDQVQ